MLLKSILFLKVLTVCEDHYPAAARPRLYHNPLNIGKAKRISGLPSRMPWGVTFESRRRFERMVESGTLSEKNSCLMEEVLSKYISANRLFTHTDLSEAHLVPKRGSSEGF